MKILICDKLDPLALQELKEMGSCVDISTEENKREKLLSHIPDTDLVFIRSATSIDEEVIKEGANLKIIARCGVGLDNVDITQATKKGVHVTNSPEANIISVAELTVGLIIATARNLIEGNNSLKQKKWDRAALTGIELHGKILGFVGFGRVARLVATRMQSFGMQIVFFDPYVKDSTENETKMELDDLLQQADVVSLHVVKNKETMNLISKEKLSLMKQDSIIVNTSRGGVVDESEVLRLVEERKLFSAALDVYEQEPPEYTAELTQSSSITLPHLGASTREAQLKAGSDTIKNVKSILSGDFSASVNAKDF
ncbi:hydroxyacid dehydrogenase [Candidatus Actinomarina sp.]|jgi:D-3-phosphoglycerate dehydrogenase|nr:hydroxyacid dehydrogenase [bacterium]MDA8653074.1 hydroxyacid dehydrogenase [Candidatus Actinomarina sp.]MDA8923332.1 hydroxyacid dehydrogenase [Acidimicrobiia bacterium]MDA8564380.1 hydroxyacid dehydrogenase [bacterium]MDA8709926.1 hydroxyacid dehydrogenase [Candidatus Actinomarina sp.]|tara:strand:+ start:3175 stop:4113 length:939 start_codon:yes stop_codon:yes gene_type:complete